MTEHKDLDLVTAKAEFIKLRNHMEKIAKDTPYDILDEAYGEAFGEIYTNATLGDIVAQDYLGYIFKRGREGLVPENIDLSMKWLILAAANGNPLSVDRLSIYLNYAYDEIIFQPDIGNIKYRNNFDEFNYTYIIGKLLCEAIVDELNITALDIIKEIPDTLEFTPARMGRYDRARDKAIPVVLNYLRGKMPESLKEKEKIEPVQKQAPIQTKKPTASLKKIISRKK